MSDLCGLNTIGVRPPGEKKTLELSEQFSKYVEELQVIKRKKKDQNVSEKTKRMLLKREAELEKTLIPGARDALASCF